jgi:hypothetical protein
VRGSPGECFEDEQVQGALEHVERGVTHWPYTSEVEARYMVRYLGGQGRAGCPSRGRPGSGRPITAGPVAGNAFRLWPTPSDYGVEAVGMQIEPPIPPPIRAPTTPPRPTVMTSRASRDASVTRAPVVLQASECLL